MRQPASNDMARRKALADAIAGVTGSVLALWAFYPIEVIKTNAQAGPPTPTKKMSKRSRSGSLLSGIEVKTLHTTFSSFAYFYIYSLIVQTWKRRQRVRGRPERVSAPARLLLSALSAMANTMLTLPLDVMAANRITGGSRRGRRHARSNQATRSSNNSRGMTDCAANDTRSVSEVSELYYDCDHGLQEEKYADSEPRDSGDENNASDTFQSDGYASGDPIDDDDDKTEQTTNVHHAEMDQVWDQLERDAATNHHFSKDDFFPLSPKTMNRKRLEGRSASSFEDEKKEEPTIEITADFAQIRRQSRASRSTARQRRVRRSSRSSYASSASRASSSPSSSYKIASLWKGLTPSLMLCTNPAINYTVYDAAKSAWLESMTHDGTAASTIAASSTARLSMGQAFLLGLFSKFVATIATYPLIRAKVMLMVTSSTSLPLRSSSSCARKQQLTLWECLKRCFLEQGGVRGLYKGSQWQLLHTALKSALMMMIKERISVISHQVLVGS